MRRPIGSAASYGCIRMRNEDIIDLFNRVDIGTPVYMYN
jgi:lipoprotein-anchoring transpeptidase ErfK/SrfK